MINVNLIGFHGQLGSEILRVINNYGNSEIAIHSTDIDITDKEKVMYEIAASKPDVIINCAAYTNVDKAEEEYEKAFKVNALGARNLAIAAESADAKIVHISTDYVFDGQGLIVDGQKVPYREYDVAKPVNVYGKTKLLGENYIRDFCSKYFIVRTAWLYGENGNNFVKTIIKAAREKGKLQVVDDQKGNPTNAEDLAKHIIRIAVTDEYGIYHCSGNGMCSWYEFTEKIVEYANIPCDVEPVSSEQFVRKAKRPSYSCMDNVMLRSTIGDRMRNWDEALYDFIRNNLKL